MKYLPHILLIFAIVFYECLHMLFQKDGFRLKERSQCKIMYQNTGNFWFLLFLSQFQFGWNVEYYKSVQWTPQNPKFEFSKGTIQQGKGHYRLSVQQNAKMIIACPHPSTYMHDEEKAIPNEQRYEAVWYVDKQSFLDCKIGSRAGHINNVWLLCDTPEKLKYDTLVFQRFSPDNLNFPPGSEHYFIATSDGTKDSLNSTSGGHCDDEANGVSMKMIIYVCINETDPICNVKTEPPTISTTGIKKSTVKVGPVTQAARKSGSWDIWHLLTIIFGVSLAVSIVIHSVCLFFVCHRRSEKKPSCDKDRLHPGTDEDGVENIQVNPVNCRV